MLFIATIYNEYGLDTISVSGTVAWAMECYNEGLLTKTDLDGIDLKWGNPEAIAALTEKICQVNGCGEILYNGSRYAADHFGKGHEYLVVASGIEEPQHDSRLVPSLGRVYQYDPTPGRHVKGGIGLALLKAPKEEKYNYFFTGFKDVYYASILEIKNSSGLCMFCFNGMPNEYINKILYAVTGFEYTDIEAYMLGLRIYNMRHAFNIREGLRRKDFTLSNRMIGKPPLADGPGRYHH